MDQVDEEETAGAGAIVGVVVASEGDLEAMQEGLETFRAFDVVFETVIISPDDELDRLLTKIRSARAIGWRTIVVGSRDAAHMGRLVATNTTLPVIAVPIRGKGNTHPTAILTTKVQRSPVATQLCLIDISMFAGECAVSSSGDRKRKACGPPRCKDDCARWAG